MTAATVLQGPRSTPGARTVLSLAWEGREPDLQQLPEDVRARVPLAQERAEAKATSTSPGATAPALLEAARSARRRSQRVIWLQRFASAWIAPYEAVSPCRRGCSHCCHQPAVITSGEAQAISAHSGRAVVTPKDALPIAHLDEPQFADRGRQLALRRPATPCPFLQDGTCTVYAVRPLACRLHVSLDDDALLCRPIPGIQVPVPQVDATRAFGAALLLQVGDVLADIRDFFPSDRMTDPMKAHADQT